MIARPLPFEEDLRPRVGTRSGRTAARRRRVRTTRLRNAPFGRVVAVVGTLTLCIVAYLGLMANVTRMNYELAKSAREKARLQEASLRLDDRIARLESRDRLALLASRLGMREAQTFVAVELPPERVSAAPGIAFLSWLK